MGRPKLSELANGESRTLTAIRIFDTAVPQVSVPTAAKMAGISRQTLYQALADREERWALRCPHCRRAPAGKRKKVSLVAKPCD